MFPLWIYNVPLHEYTDLDLKQMFQVSRRLFVIQKQLNLTYLPWCNTKIVRQIYHSQNNCRQ